MKIINNKQFINKCVYDTLKLFFNKSNYLCINK